MKQEQNSYYGTGDYQPIDMIDRLHMDFNLANALKYVVRAGNKPGEAVMKDLNKAKDYLNNFEKRLKINCRIMFELRKYYSIIDNYSENIYDDYLRDLKESGIHDTAYHFAESVLNLYNTMYYMSYSSDRDETIEDFNELFKCSVPYLWESIKSYFDDFYEYCESITKIDTSFVAHLANGQSITLYSEEPEPIRSDNVYRQSTEYYVFVVYGENGYCPKQQVLIPTSSFFEITNSISNEITDLYNDTPITKNNFVELCTGRLMEDINYDYAKWFANPYGKINKDIINNIKSEAILRFKSDYDDYFTKDGFLKKLFK